MLLLLAISFVLPYTPLLKYQNSGWEQPSADRIKNYEAKAKKFLRFGQLGLVVVLLLIILSGSYVIIKPGYVGVKVFFGTVEEDVLYNGFHIVNPLVDIKQINVQLHEYTMSTSQKEGKVEGDDAVRAASSDNLEIYMDITTWWRPDVNKVSLVYKDIGELYEEKVVRPAIRNVITDIAAKFPAMELYSSKRDEYALAVQKRLEVVLQEKGFILDKFLLRNVNPPDAVVAAINNKIKAEQEAEQMKYVLLKEKQEAERKEVEAQGIHKFQQIVSQGISEPLIKWKYLEVMKDVAHSQNSKIWVFGNSDGKFVYNP